MAKKNIVLIKLVSSADTGFYYVAKKNPKTKTEKLAFRKYDPVVRKHVVFNEANIKLLLFMNFFCPALAADDNTAANSTAAGQGAANTAVNTVPYDLSAEKMMQDNFIILGVLFFIFYFILIKPQQKRVKQQQEMMK